jgi:hypothetical protein
MYHYGYFLRGVVKVVVKGYGGEENKLFLFLIYSCTVYP